MGKRGRPANPDSINTVPVQFRMPQALLRRYDRLAIDLDCRTRFKLVEVLLDEYDQHQDLKVKHDKLKIKFNALNTELKGKKKV